MRKKGNYYFEKNYEDQKELLLILKEHASDILCSEKFKETRNHIQHGSIAVHRHCMDVARQSLKISRALHIPVNEREMVRGALLHDYFLYDWHDTSRENYQFWHGFYHPGIALSNAERDFDLSQTERDIIKKHMWPLTVVPPKCKEAWVVTMADKYCSTLETLKLRKGVVRRSVVRSEINKRGK